MSYTERKTDTNVQHVNYLSQKPLSSSDINELQSIIKNDICQFLSRESQPTALDPVRFSIDIDSVRIVTVPVSGTPGSITIPFSYIILDTNGNYLVGSIHDDNLRMPLSLGVSTDLYMYYKIREVGIANSAYKYGLRSNANFSYTETAVENNILDPVLAEEVTTRNVLEFTFTVGQSYNLSADGWSSGIKVATIDYTDGLSIINLKRVDSAKSLIKTVTCNTASGTKDKVVSTGDNWMPQPGDLVGVKYYNTNTYASSTTNPVTLSVNGIKGTIWYGSSHSGVGNTGAMPTVYGYANRYIYYEWDGTYWIWVNIGWISEDIIAPSAYCDTAAGTAAKVASCTGYTLLDKSYVHVLIRNSNTSASALTLNINNTGAKSIYINGTASSSTNYTLPAGTYLAYYASNIFYFRTDGKLTASITGDAGTVNGKTVEVSVPSNALFTDANTAQTATITNANYEVLFSGTADNTNRTEGTRKNSNLLFNPSTGNLTATQLNGVAIGNSPKFTDTNNAVAQTVTTGNANYEVLFSVTADNTTRTEGARKNNNFLFNPSTGNLQVTQLNGVTVGSSPKFTDTTYSAGSNITQSGTVFSLTKANVTGALGYTPPTANTNDAVTQTATTTNANYEVLFSATNDNTTRTEGARKNSNLLFNPYTGNLTVTQLNGVTVGSSPKFTDTTYSAGSNITQSGTVFSLTKANVTNALGYTPPTVNTNDAVTQTATTTNADYEVLFSVTADNITRTEGARKNSNLKFNPSTGNLTATNFNGKLNNLSISLVT